MKEIYLETENRLLSDEKLSDKIIKTLHCEGDLSYITMQRVYTNRHNLRVQWTNDAIKNKDNTVFKRVFQESIIV